jgi:hypothetical protein
MYLNKNIALNQLEEIINFRINSKVEYLPSSFQEQQLDALQIFKKRFFLEEVIEESISFNKKLFILLMRLIFPIFLIKRIPY